MSVMPIEPSALAGSLAATAPASAAKPQPVSGEDFAAALGRGLDHVSQLQQTADSLAVQAATGDLQDVHDYTIAATQAQLATELTVAVRNKAVEAFNDVMRMPL